MQAIAINPAEVTEEYMRENGLVFMDYYRWRILGTRKQVQEFAYQGMLECDGSARDRLTDIYIEATSGAMICRDWCFDGEDPYEGGRKLMSWDAWQAE